MSTNSKKEQEGYSYLHSRWKEAFADRRCWIAGCDLSQSLCGHASHFIDWEPESSSKYNAGLKHELRSDIDSSAEAIPLHNSNSTAGVWEAFKTLRSLLPFPETRFSKDRRRRRNQQILIWIRCEALGQPQAQVRKELGIPSKSNLERDLAAARAALRAIGGQGNA